eukprot:10028741-Karenia_brevis.AAC.1
MMYLGARIFRACVALNIPSSIENPERSRLWLAPAMKSLLKMRKSTFYVTDMCMWGAQWRKRT